MSRKKKAGARKTEKNTFRGPDYGMHSAVAEAAVVNLVEDVTNAAAAFPEGPPRSEQVRHLLREKMLAIELAGNREIWNTSVRTKIARKFLEHVPKEWKDVPGVWLDQLSDLEL